MGSLLRNELEETSFCSSLVGNVSVLALIDINTQSQMTYKEQNMSKTMFSRILKLFRSVATFILRGPAFRTKVQKHVRSSGFAPDKFVETSDMIKGSKDTFAEYLVFI